MGLIFRESLVGYLLQPIVSNVNNSIDYFEILGRVKLRNGKSMAISPDIAYKYTHYLINYASTLIKYGFLNNLSITLNLSKNEINIKIINFLKEKFSILEAHRVLIEVTEDVLIDINKAALLYSLKAYGFRIALDDFCSEKSVRNLICEYDFIDVIKFDGIFLQTIQKGQLHVIKGLDYLNSFAKSLGKKTIIEYVETHELMNLVKDIDADYWQGYYFGKPQPLEVYEKQICIP